MAEDRLDNRQNIKPKTEKEDLTYIRQCYKFLFRNKYRVRMAVKKIRKNIALKKPEKNNADDTNLAVSIAAGI